MALAGLTGPRQLDVLDGSPPCQGFSTAGKRNFNDDRNQLFREYVRLLRGLQPKVFVMENVSGMVKGKMKLIFAEIMRELKASGYVVSARLLNAMWFGVPQSRERMIFIGVREDLGIVPSHPKAESRPVTVGGGLLEVKDDGTGNRVGAHTKIWQAMKTVKPGMSQPGHHSHVRLNAMKPSPALRRAGDLAHYHYWHPVEHRVITMSECRRLASFPDSFQQVGSVGLTWSRIGNSVPPLFMRAIALHIRHKILASATGSSYLQVGRTNGREGCAD